MKDFVKKIEELSSLCEDKKAEKVLRKFWQNTLRTSIAFRNWLGRREHLMRLETFFIMFIFVAYKKH